MNNFVPTGNPQAVRPFTTWERWVAVCYLYSLPVLMLKPLVFLKLLFLHCANYTAFFFHVWGLLLLLWHTSTERQTESIAASPGGKLFQNFAFLIIFFEVSSVVMATVLFIPLGEINGETTFHGILTMEVFFLQYLFMFYYNWQIFRRFSLEELYRIFDRIMLILLGIGLLQIFVITVGGPFITFYDTFIHIWQSPYEGIGMNQVGRLCLTGSEAASAGNLIAAFVFPYLFGRLFASPRKYFFWMQILLWLPVLFFTKSSTGFIEFCVFLICVFVLCWKMFFSQKILRNLLLIMAVAALVGTVTSHMWERINLEYNVTEEIQYKLLEKAIDENNQSTVSRKIPLVINWGAFSEYPLLGVGNGNQGYFYRKYFPSWGYNSPEAIDWLNGALYGIANGALFLPSILSGYGIVGMVFLISFFVMCFRSAFKFKARLGAFYYMYILAFPVVLLAGLSSEFYARYWIWFILSIPLMADLVSGESIPRKREE